MPIPSTYKAWKKLYDSWVAERPKDVQALLEQFPIWNSYNIDGSSPFDCRVVGVDEHADGQLTLRVYVESPTFPRQVFGIKKESLVLTKKSNPETHYSKLRLAGAFFT